MYLKLSLMLVVLMASPTKPCAASATAPTQHPGVQPVEKDTYRHEEILARKEHLIRTGGTNIVFIGDSITDGWRQDPQREIFEDYFGLYRPYNIGVGGDQTQHVLWRIGHGELDGIAPKVAVLMIGTNNLGYGMTPEETVQGITRIVTTVRQQLPNSKLLLLGILPRGKSPEDPFRALIKKTNKMLSALDDGSHIVYRDIGAAFLDSNGYLSANVMPDYLHPNAAGYEIWARAIKGTIDESER